MSPTRERHPATNKVRTAAGSVALPHRINTHVQMSATHAPRLCQTTCLCLCLYRPFLCPWLSLFPCLHSLCPYLFYLCPYFSIFISVPIASIYPFSHLCLCAFFPLFVLSFVSVFLLFSCVRCCLFRNCFPVFFYPSSTFGVRVKSFRSLVFVCIIAGLHLAGAVGLFLARTSYCSVSPLLAMFMPRAQLSYPGSLLYRAELALKAPMSACTESERSLNGYVAAHRRLGELRALLLRRIIVYVPHTVITAA